LNYKAIIERIVDTSQEYLNDWEIEFISSVYNTHVLRNRRLTEAQEKKIIQINRKVLNRNE
jgi:hypothetical protein